MSGTKFNLKESVLNTLRSVPVVVEILLIVSPILIAGCFYMYTTIMRVLVSHDMKYYSLTAEHMISIQGDRLLAAMDQNGDDAVDLRLMPVDILSSQLNNIASSRLEAWFLGHDEGQERDPIYLRYLILEADGSISEFDGKTGIMYGKDSTPEERELTNLMGETELPWDGTELQEVSFGGRGHAVDTYLLPIPVKKKVCYGDIPLRSPEDANRLILGCYILEDEVMKDCRFRTMKAAVIGLGALLIVIIPAFIVALRSLRGLRIMRRYMDSVSTKTVPRELSRALAESEDTSSAEITELLINFQLMALKIQDYQEDVGTIMTLFEPLVPGAILKLFGKEDIRELNPGDRAEAEGAALTARLVSGRESEQPEFSVRNQLITDLLDIVKSKGGLIMELGYDHLTAFFPETDGEVTASGLAFACAEEFKKAERTDSGVRRIRTVIREGSIGFIAEGTPERMDIRLEEN